MKTCLILVCLLSTGNACAGVIRADTLWSGGFYGVENGHPSDLIQSLSGSVSAFYEEGSTQFNSMTFFDADGSALFTTSAPIVVTSSLGTNGGDWEVYTAPFGLINQQNNEIFSIFSPPSYMHAQTDPLLHYSVEPTLDNWTGFFHMTSNYWGGVTKILNLDFSVQNLQRTPVSTVPEPGSLALLAAGIVGMGIARRLKR